MNLTLTVALCVWAVGVQLNEALAAVGAYGTTLLVLLSVRPSRQDVKRWWPLLAFVAWGLLVPLALGAVPTGSGVARLTDWLLLPVAAVAVTRARSLRPVALAAAVACTASCIAAGLQHFGYWPPLEFFAPLSFMKTPFARVYEPTGDGRFMAGGLAFHRLKFSSVTALVVIAAAANWKHRRAAALAAFGFVSVAVFPMARAAAGALALALGTLVKPRWLAAVLLAIVAAAGLWKRTSGERLELMQGAANAVKQHPLSGTGLGRFRHVDYAAPGASPIVLEHVGKAHNQALTFAAEGGVALALLFVLMLAWLGRELWRTPESAARSAGLAGFVFFVLLCLLHDPLFHPVVSQGVMLLLGGSLGLARKGESA